MARLVGVHGIAKHQLGRHQLLASWAPAVADGLERAVGRPMPPPGLDMAFYGDVFLPAPGQRADGRPPGTGGRVPDGVGRPREDGRAKGGPGAGAAGPFAAGPDQWDEAELAELTAAAADLVTPEEIAAAAAETAMGYTRTPRALGAVLRAVDRRFGATAGVLYLGVLRQVRRYLTDPVSKARVDARVAKTVGDGCRVLIGHSLGSVVAYEYLRQRPDHKVELLVTIGSPLGLRMVRDRLAPGRLDVHRWVNVRDVRDPVTCAGNLDLWWTGVNDETVENGGDAHDAARYLSKEATGRALLTVLPELAA